MSEADRHAVLAMVTFYGGRYQSQLNPRCTHLITPIPHGAKYACAVKHPDTVKVVTPKWIIDSVKAGHCMNENCYELPCPTATVENENVQESVSRPVGIKTGSDVTKTVSEPSTVVAADKNSQRSAETGSDVSKSLTVVVADERSRLSLHDGVNSDNISTHEESRIASKVTAVCEEIAGEETKTNVKTVCDDIRGEEIVTLDDSLTQHESTEVSVVHVGCSNNQSDRETTEQTVAVLEKEKCFDGNGLSEAKTDGACLPDRTVMCEVTGKAAVNEDEEGMVETEKTDKVQASRSSTSSPNGESKDGIALKEITVSSRISDTDKFLQGCYFVFVDYPDLVGEETIKRWSQFIGDHGGSVLRQYDKQCTHLLACNQLSRVYARALVGGTKIATLYWLSDKLMEKSLSPPSRPLHLPVPFATEVFDCRSMIITCSGYAESWERRHVKDMVTTIGAQYTSSMTRGNTHLICKRASGEKFAKAKDWDIVVVNGRWLSDIVLEGIVPDPSRNRYTVDDDVSSEICLDTSVKVVQRILSCWGQTFSSTDAEMRGTKRTASEAELSPVLFSEKWKRDNQWSYSSVPTVMFTGLDSAEVKRLTMMVLNLGGLLAESEMTCTHLIAKEVHRTVKFLSVISVCRFVVRPEWLENSYKTRWFLDENDYPVRDTVKEQQWQFSLERTLELAHQRPLLDGMSIYATASVVPSPSQLQTIVNCAGGTFLTVPPSSRGETLSNGHPSVIVISCIADRLQCRPFFEVGIDVYGVELILTGVLQQNLDYSSNRIHSC